MLEALAKKDQTRRCENIYTYIYTHIYIYTYIHIHIYTYTYTCVYTYICLCMCIHYTCICIHLGLRPIDVFSAWEEKGAIKLNAPCITEFVTLSS